MLAGCGGSSSSTGESTTAGDSAAAVEEARQLHEYIHGRCEDYHSEYQGEIQTQEELAQEYKELTGGCRGFRRPMAIHLPRILPRDAHEVPTIFMGRHSGHHYADEYALTQPGEDWAKDGGSGLRMQLQRVRLIGFPSVLKPAALCITRQQLKRLRRGL